MSKLEELIQELCPGGVEYKPIGEVVNYEQPTKYIVESTKYDDNYDIPVLTAGQSFILGYTNEEEGIYNASKINPVIIFDDFTGAFKWVDFPFKVKSSAMKILKADTKKTTLRYIFHVMGNIDFSSGEHKRLWITIYSTFQIPLPPLEVQQEIVRILDSFTGLTTELTTELTAELTARKQQYEYYKEKLLNFSENVDGIMWRPLGELATFINGKGHEKNISADGKYIVVNSKFISTMGTVRKFSNLQLCPLYKDDILMVMSDLPNGRALSKCFLVDEDDKYTLNQRIGAFHSLDTQNLNTRFLFYVLDRNQQLLKFDNGVDQTNLKKDDILSVLVPVPSLSMQEHIVRVLDGFNTFCNDLTIGLPAEIEARQKQYEYYRDKLLTFKKLA